MSAFQSYGGVYEFKGRSYAWRCYATARVYEVRMSDHTPPPPAPEGRKWVRRSQHASEVEYGCLVDAHVADFSQILLQVEPERRVEERRGRLEETAAA